MYPRRIAAAFFALALALTVILLAPPVQAHPGHKVGPVCTAKQAKKHPGKCIVILTPKAPADQTIVIDLGGK